MSPKNDWNAYRELFLHEMKENGKQFIHITGALEALGRDVSSIKIDVGGLKVKAAVAGGIAGIVGTGLMTIIVRLFK